MSATREVADLGGTFTVDIVHVESDHVIARLTATGHLSGRYGARQLRIGVGSWPEVVEPRHLSELEALIADELLGAVRFIQRQKAHDWLEHVGPFIPKTIREPWIGDLREDRAGWKSDGHGRLYVETRTVSQLVCLVGAVLRRYILDVIIWMFGTP